MFRLASTTTTTTSFAGANESVNLLNECMNVYCMCVCAILCFDVAPGKTLVLPSLSTANLPQATIDRMIGEARAERIGFFDAPEQVRVS